MYHSERLGIYVNMNSRPDAISFAKQLGRDTGNPVRELNGSVDMTHTDAVVVAGGDGSVRSVLQQMVDEQTYTPIAVIPGGSENGLWHALRDAGATTTYLELTNSVRDPFPLLHPGAINEVLFHHAAGWDPFLIKEAVLNEALRPVFLRKLRGYVGGAIAILTSDIGQDASGNEYTLRLATTSRFIGGMKIPMFSTLLLHSDNVGILRIRGDHFSGIKAKIALLTAYIMLGWVVPPEIVDARKQKSLFTPQTNPDSRVNADGEVIPMEKTGIIYVRKTADTIPVAAVVAYKTAKVPKREGNPRVKLSYRTS